MYATYEREDLCSESYLVAKPVGFLKLCNVNICIKKDMIAFVYFSPTYSILYARTALFQVVGKSL